jgi:ribonuclease PH
MPHPARADGRKLDELRPVSFEAGFAPHATGSVLIRYGSTQVICAATIDPGVPTWMKQQGVKGGWLTAEYSMLPYSTHERKARDINKGRLDGRTVEIQRLIGRSLRAAIDLDKLGQNTLWLDCDVLQADGGTRTAAITGAYVAARLAVQKLIDQGRSGRARSPTRWPRSAWASSAAPRSSTSPTSRTRTPRWTSTS